MAIGRILVPIDGSVNSFRGLDMAISVAKAAGASVTLVHSVDEQPRTEFSSAEQAGGAGSGNAGGFVGRAEKALGRNGVPFKTKIVHGNAGYGILKLAHSKSGGFDMIVIGSRGRGAVREMFFGSTSNYVIHSSRIPVLVVK